MVFLLLGPLLSAKADTTSLARRDRGDADGGASRSRAASPGAEAARAVLLIGASQNMYMYPASSESTYGLASSASSADAVVVSTESGIRSLNWAVCDALDFRELLLGEAAETAEAALRCCFDFLLGLGTDEVGR
jgi:hypothetical protein